MIVNRKLQSLLGIDSKLATEIFSGKLKAGDEVKFEEARKNRPPVTAPARVRDYANVENAITCCGVMEISELPNSGADKSVARLIMEDMDTIESGGDSFGAYIYYGINKEIIASLKSIGFKVIGKFKNHNTGNIVTILMLEV